MKTSLVIATLVVVGAGAAGAGATFAVQPYLGSDTEFEITNQALANSSLGNLGDYTGGGSGNGENAMTASTPLQRTAPMSKMMTNQTCKVVVPSTTAYTHATGIAFGLDAVNVYSFINAGGAAACNGTPSQDDAGLGLVYSNSSFGNWTDMLALLYGGLDKTTGATDCGSAKRKALVANWSNLFQTGCANGITTCNTANLPTTSTTVQIGGQLWHAFRRDDNSGTADVFASLLGLGQQTDPSSPSTKTVKTSVSSSAVHGFGQTPYCNAINWDTRDALCTGGAGKQFIGPGGVPQGICTVSGNTNLCSDVAGGTNTCTDGTDCGTPGTAFICSLDNTACSTEGAACGSGGAGVCVVQCVDRSVCQPCNCAAIDTQHRRPPYLTWGTVPDSALIAAAAVLPTSYQDNDPIRRRCIGSGNNLVGTPTNPRSSEEVCNRDGTLGLVLPVPPVDFVPRNFSGRNPFPTTTCDGTEVSEGQYNLFKCGPRGTVTPAGCLNGDTNFGGNCSIPQNAGNTLCFALPVHNVTIGNYTKYDGRVHNLALTDGSTGFTTFTVPSVPVTYVFQGHYGRIHSQSSLLDPANVPGTKGTNCQNQDATDQIGCLTQADPCSIGFAGDNAKTWGSRATYVDGGSAPSNDTALRVNQIASTVTTVQNGSYDFWRKIYFNSSGGFDNLVDAGAGPAAELALAQFESKTSSITPILAQFGFFALGGGSPNGTDTPFCEDFNEQLIGCTDAGNSNACNRNVGIPVNPPSTADAAAFAPVPSDPSPNPANATTSTVCGNGIKEAFEDCDNGLANGTSGNSCSATCRFVFP
jgi:hypothetical protein